eukprot:TRINITY_DN13329_c0_g1_i1.p1 TRINITY_DN13329_c0_g1~~TRINITY_DN13329_c0_g1_i1.p1  ORF type:complete len:220 (-),score=41.21 TRINITY_DN13329_c0_g1_i1:21-680(-)
MVRHNNVVPNGHFHKAWQERVKTWFDQPGKKKSRRQKRAAKAKRLFPRPSGGLLRPIVRCPTIKYNSRTRLGRGFTIAELKEAGIHRKEARHVGVAVDSRRINRSEEGFILNVQRLKTYRSNLILFPRKPNRKQRKGDSTKEECEQASQVSGVVMPLVAPSKVVVEEMSIKDARELYAKDGAFRTLRHVRADARLIGRRKKRAEEAAEKKALLARRRKK